MNLQEAFKGDLSSAQVMDALVQLGWARDSPGKGAALFSGYTVIKLLATGYNNLTQRDHLVEKAKLVAIIKIAGYVKDHPDAKKEDLAAEIQKQMTEFELAVNAIDKKHTDFLRAVLTPGF